MTQAKGVDQAQQLARAVVEHDELLKSYAGPLDVLCEGDLVAADQSFDRMVALARAIITDAQIDGAKGGE